MPAPSDSPHIIARWHEVAAETEDLLRRQEELMQVRIELFRRRAELFGEIVAGAQCFVENLAPDGLSRDKLTRTADVPEEPDRSPKR